MCYRVKVFPHFENGQLSQHCPQARAARKKFEDAETNWYHVNGFSILKIDRFLNIAPKRAQRGNFNDAGKIWYHVNVFSHFETFGQQRTQNLFILNRKTLKVCGDKIQTPANRKVCVDKIQTSATRKV